MFSGSDGSEGLDLGESVAMEDGGQVHISGLELRQVPKVVPFVKSFFVSANCTQKVVFQTFLSDIRPIVTELKF